MPSVLVKNIRYHFVKPYYLRSESQLIGIKATFCNGRLVWNIKGEKISYNQLKKLKSFKKRV